ncbi:hypothetical protein KR059_011240, partial [Drosophila kikkawai]
STSLNPSQFIKIGKGSYYIETVSRKNWFAAYESCRQMKASLIAFESLDEWKLVNQYLRDMQIYRKYWTAGTDWAEQGKHVWFSNGQPLSLDIWRAGEPNNYNGDEHCDEAGPAIVPWLNDIVCTTLRIYICKAPEAPSQTEC